MDSVGQPQSQGISSVIYYDGLFLAGGGSQCPTYLLLKERARLGRPGEDTGGTVHKKTR